MTLTKIRRFGLVSVAVGTTLAALCALSQCSSPASDSSGAATDSAAAWNTIYTVLQHPRCLNCHPVGDAPFVGESRQPHPQNVHRGAEGNGSFGMRCATCHQSANLPGAHLPPGSPNWHMPNPAMPLVFEGRSSGDLCRQLRDAKQNGGKTPEQLLQHMSEDPLVLWGWSPGDGRPPVSIPHADLVKAVRAWVDGGCDCPK
jgi:hypothetical protein